MEVDILSAREIKNSGSNTPSAHFVKLEEEFPTLIPSALLEPDYDNTINTLVDKNIITPVIAQIDLPLATNRCVAANKFHFKFNNGSSKEDKRKYSLTSSVAACMFKALQISDSFGNIIATMPSIILSLMDKYTMNEETITEPGLSYMVMAVAAQVFITRNIVDTIAKHFPLIVLPSYMRQCADLDKYSSSKENKAKSSLTSAATPVGQLMATKIFVQFIVEHKTLKTMVEKSIK